MENSFGNDYRKEVQDVNEGRSTTEQSTLGTTTSQAATGKQTQYIEDAGNRHKPIQRLLGFAAETLTGINIKAQQEEYQNAYKNASQAKLDEINKDESGIFSLIYGKSATQRGFHKRVLQTETQQYELTQIQRLDKAIRANKNPEDYQKTELNPAMKTALDKQSDSKMRADLVQNMSRINANLGQQFVAKRAVYDQVLNRRATQEHLRSSIALYNNSKHNTAWDNKTAAQLKTKLTQAFTVPPKDMAQDAHQDVVTNEVTAALAQGNPAAAQILDDLIENKKVKLTPDNAAKYQAAKELYTKENDFRFKQDQFKLQAAEANLADNYEPLLAQLKAKYGSAVNVSASRTRHQRYKLQAVAQAEQLAGDRNLVLSNQPVSTPERRRAAINSIQGSIGTRLVEIARQEQLRQQQANNEPPENWIDPNKAITQEEQDKALLDNPNTVLEIASSRNAIMPIMRQVHTKLSTLLNQEKHTPDNIIQIKQLQKFNKQSKNRNFELYSKSAISKSELARTESLSYLTKSGMPVKQALMTIRRYASHPAYDWKIEDPDGTAFNKAVENIYDDAEDKLGFTRQFGHFTNDADNREATTWYARKAFQQAMAIVKNPEVAAAIAPSFMAQDSTRIGQQLILGGADLDKGAKLTAHEASLNAMQSPQFQQKMRDAQIQDGADLLDGTWHIQPHPNGNGWTFSGQNTNGDWVFIGMEKPTRAADIYVPPPAQPLTGLPQQPVPKLFTK